MIFLLIFTTFFFHNKNNQPSRKKTREHPSNTPPPPQTVKKKQNKTIQQTVKTKTMNSFPISTLSSTSSSSLTSTPLSSPIRREQEHHANIQDMSCPFFGSTPPAQRFMNGLHLRMSSYFAKTPLEEERPPLSSPTTTAK